MRRPPLVAVGKARLLLAEEAPDLNPFLALDVLDQAQALSLTPRRAWAAPRDRRERITTALAIVLVRLRGRLTLAHLGVPAPSAVESLRVALLEMQEKA